MRKQISHFQMWIGFLAQNVKKMMKTMNVIHKTTQNVIATSVMLKWRNHAPQDHPNESIENQEIKQQPTIVTDEENEENCEENHDKEQTEEEDDKRNDDKTGNSETVEETDKTVNKMDRKIETIIKTMRSMDEKEENTNSHG